MKFLRQGLCTIDRCPESSREMRHRLCAALFRAGHTSLAILREIFDESAYNRFLIRKQLYRSQDSYAAFRVEHEIRQSRRPKCC